MAYLLANTKIGWTANPHVHWIVSLIGVTIYGFGVFILLQCIL
jgi:MFS transporter, DHA1 family, multidrug resistance protein